MSNTAIHTSSLDSLKSNLTLTINVGGQRHEILWKSLSKSAHSATRLGRLRTCRTSTELLKQCDFYDERKNEIFFDRSPKSFSAILGLYRNGKIHIPRSICVQEFETEMEYWGVSELSLDSCCQIRFQQWKEAITEEVAKDSELLFEKVERFHGPFPKLRKILWEFLEKSETFPQKIFTALSLAMIVLSLVTLTLATHPDFLEFRCKNSNLTTCDIIRNETISPHLPKEYFEEIEHPTLKALELVCIIFFTLELILRIISSPSFKKLLSDSLLLVDFLTVLPFYLELFLSGTAIDVLRVLRILRIFKLGQHITAFRGLFFTLRQSYKNLGVLALFLGTGTIIFSTLAYFAEREKNPEGFPSIIEAFYWAIITMTTVGYGDISPVTTWGKIVGTATAIAGIVMIALPIPVIADNFTAFYAEERRKAKALKRHQAIQNLRRKVSSQRQNVVMALLGPIGMGLAAQKSKGAEDND